MSLIQEVPGLSSFFRFMIEGQNVSYIIPQNITDGSDTVQFSSNWSKMNLPGSTEPMVAFNYVDSPIVNINLKFQEDMWREVPNIPANSSYLNVISAFASMVYPSASGDVIKPPYCLVDLGNGTVYRGYFTNIRINQYGIMRNGYKISCEITSTLNIIKKTSPKQLDIGNGFRSYFADLKAVSNINSGGMQG